MASGQKVTVQLNMRVDPELKSQLEKIRDRKGLHSLDEVLRYVLGEMRRYRIMFKTINPPFQNLREQKRVLKEHSNELEDRNQALEREVSNLKGYNASRARHDLTVYDVEQIIESYLESKYDGHPQATTLVELERPFLEAYLRQLAGAGIGGDEEADDPSDED